MNLNKTDQEDLEVIFGQYLKLHDELALDYKTHHRYLDPQHWLDNRDIIQEELEKDPSIFDKHELLKLKQADQFLLDNVKTAAEWVRFTPLYIMQDIPKSRWWWYLHYISDGVMEVPDLDKTYREYFERID